jgi:NAD(P)-dependent dehydrogenase (short-subunit alcohol dehydrogenase family)
MGGNMKLLNKKAIVTGSSLGIGKGIALALAKEGADIVINYHSHKEEADKVAKKIRDLGRKCIVIKADIGSVKEIDEMFSIVSKEFEGIDILVNNAGVSEYYPLNEITEEIWDKTLSINLKGAFFCSKFAAEEMKKRKGGKIVNIASCGAILGFASLPHYCASKGGLVALTRQMAVDLAKYKINVNCIGPGAIITERSQKVWEDEKTRKAWEEIIPLSKIGEVEDLVEGVVYLCSEGSSYVTGQTIYIEGGWSVAPNWPGSKLL